MESLVLRGAAGGILSAAISFAAYRRTALTRSGAWAAAVTGLVLVLAGWRWLALVGLFFITSSILTRLEAPRPGHATAPRRSTDRGGRRWEQVAANGGVAAICAAAAAVSGWPQGFMVAAGSIAAATADTWATELGRWSRSAPRLITTGAVVAPGVSGGVTAAGTLASIAGAVFIALVALALAPASDNGAAAQAAGHARVLIGAWITLAGITGSLLDSVLGATMEGRVAWLTNDTVNLAATTWGAALVFYLSSSRYM